MSLVLLTSIPPVQRRYVEGVDLSKSYQEYCFESFARLADRIYSVNSIKEKNSLPEDERLTYFFYEQDAEHLVGKPVVYLDSFLKACASIDADNFVLTNSDVALEFCGSIINRMKGGEPGTAFIAHRYDVNNFFDKSISRKKIHSFGFDFFCFSHQDVKYLENSPFIFGIPWWDHFVPVALILNNVCVVNIESEPVLHLQHSERWSLENWLRYGNLFITHILELSDKVDLCTEAKVSYYRELRKINLIKLPTFIDIFVCVAKGRRLRDQIDIRKMKLLARLNSRLIMGSAARI